MTVCRLESTAGHHDHWASPNFWERVSKLNPRLDPSAAAMGRIAANVTGFMAESGICKLMRLSIEQDLHDHPPQDGSVTPDVVEIHRIMARTERQADGRRNCRLVVSYPVLIGGERTMAFHDTDLYGWTEPGILPEYEQVLLLQEIETKLHTKALEFDSQQTTQTV